MPDPYYTVWCRREGCWQMVFAGDTLKHALAELKLARLEGETLFVVNRWVCVGCMP